MRAVHSGVGLLRGRLRVVVRLIEAAVDGLTDLTPLLRGRLRRGARTVAEASIFETIQERRDLVG
jgi:hypothetical protein